MRRVFSILPFLIFPLLSFAGTAVAPNTTLQAQTGNNTSASPYFTSKSNGTLGAGNVSEISVKNLLYAGATTKIYAHLMAWFGSSSHINVGYDSDDPAQVKRQVAAMKKRGIDGVIIDWYGRNRTREDRATYYFKEEGERLNGSFKFAIMEDKGALKKCAETKGCNITTELISDLNYAYSHYWSSPAYIRSDGRPVVFFFGLEAYSIDWSRVRSSVAGNPLFIRQNAGGFTKTQSNGSFGWVIIDRSNPNNIGLSYLDNFYSTAIKYSNKKMFGAAYKGFNDSIAGWHPNPYRLMNQSCGQTWLATWNRIRKFYSTSNQLPNMQLVTWNDYEEGTSLETGIDNCVKLSASTDGTIVNWSLTGQQNTVSNFSIFISPDGKNLMKVTDVSASSRKLDLKSWAFPSGTYTVYVKAVGKPLIRNKMSSGVTIRIPSTSTSTSSTSLSTYGVKITSPANNSTSGTSVHITASASSNVAITAMQVYVDNVKVLATSAAKIDSYIKMSVGTRYVVVQAWDASGKIYKSSVYVKIQ